MAYIVFGILRLFGTLLQFLSGSLRPRAALVSENLFYAANSPCTENVITSKPEDPIA